MVGPKYHRPTAPVAPAYKEPPPPQWKEWKQATPMEGVLRGKWWEIYHDPILNDLEDRVAISNQNVLAAEARYREAAASIKVARSALFPTLSTGPSVNVSGGSGGVRTGAVTATGTVLPGGNATPGAGGSSGISHTITLPFELTWEADLWGAVRRSVRAAKETAQASAADLANVRLSYQAALGQDYFSLRGLDTREALLRRAVDLYRQYLTLTEERFHAGIASAADVALAQTQLETAQAELIDAGVQRAAYEHAIAVLTGRPPAELTLKPAAIESPPPPVPVGVPSSLLERRPDIAAAERTMAAANEQIGIARAAYYPTVSLTAAAGIAASTLGSLFSAPARFWSLGPNVSETILDFGRRRGTLQGAEAAYDAQVATYRQTVLTAFQQVEDNLSALRILQEEGGAVDRAVASAQLSLHLSDLQYRAGLLNFLQVITVQTTLLNEQVTAINVMTNRMVDSVLLVQALGGGWDVADLPKL